MLDDEDQFPAGYHLWLDVESRRIGKLGIGVQQEVSGNGRHEAENRQESVQWRH